MNKKKVLMLSKWYPLSISRYFEKAFQNRDDIELRTVGPYTGNKIPWMGGMELPMKYAKCPTYPTFPMTNSIYWSMISPMLKEWIPDLVVTVDASINWEERPDIDGYVVTIATDPHVLNYDHARNISDLFFNMQRCYSQIGDTYLPYAFSSYDHYSQSVEKDNDAVLIGMPYRNRIDWVNELRSAGVSVLFSNGPIFDEYREINNHARIGLNFSSLDDMVARVFELMAMGLCPVINRVPDLPEFFVEGIHYLGFSTVDEGVAQVLWAKNNPEKAQEIAKSAHDLVWKPSYTGYPQHSYSERVETIMQKVGLSG